MKQQKHKRKESFSLLLISNTGKDIRQFYISLHSLRLIIVLMALICVTLVWNIYRSGTHRKSESEFRKKLVAQEQLIKQLENEKETLSEKNEMLAVENETLKQFAMTDAKTMDTEEKQENKIVNDTSIPSQYPYTGVGALKEQYSEEHPCFSISTQLEDHIVAAGDGTIASVGSNDTYPLIVVIEHGNGYLTQYLCTKEAQVQVAAGDQVQMKETLIIVDKEDTQLDYQVIYEEQVIDPLLVLEAKG
ncbi:hypothetical protein IMSAGC011_01908 [Lachnospiraceae bacterium]|nr:hypothetical protein IMSAGC011_01908 [Lachnospiraceae bacterium]